MTPSRNSPDSLLNYAIDGDGVPVVLVHGFGEDSRIWDNQVAFLRQHCKVMTPDLPGSGQSSGLPVSDVKMGDYATLLCDWLKTERIEQCILLGHSMGGYITLAFADLFPNMLKGFGLVHSTAFADSDEKKANRLQGIKMMEEHGAYSFLKNTTPNLFSKAFKAAHSEEINNLIEKGKQFKKEDLISYYKSMMNREDLTSVLKNASVPVLFIIGTEDVAAPLNDLLQQVHLPKQATIHIMENVGHMSMMEQPDKLNEYLLDFIKSVTE